MVNFGTSNFGSNNFGTQSVSGKTALAWVAARNASAQTSTRTGSGDVPTRNAEAIEN